MSPLVLSIHWSLAISFSDQVNSAWGPVRLLSSSTLCMGLLAVHLIIKINNSLNIKVPKMMHLSCKSIHYVQYYDQYFRILYHECFPCNHASHVCLNIKRKTFKWKNSLVCTSLSCHPLHHTWFKCALQTTTVVGLILMSLGNRVGLNMHGLHVA